MTGPEEFVGGFDDEDDDDTESTPINLNTSSFSMKKVPSDEAVDVIFIADFLIQADYGTRTVGMTGDEVSVPHAITVRPFEAVISSCGGGVCQ